jgi:Putative auto-transporter adhesin, head GIN domain
MKRFLLLLFFPAIIFTSCRGIFGKRVIGDGNLKTETRSPGQFNNVEVSGSIDLYVKQDSMRSVKIEADQNLLEYIEVFTEADKLVVRSKNGFNLRPSQDIKVYVSSPVFKKFEASGACDIYSENQVVSSDAIELEMSGSCDGKLDLKAPKIVTDLSGACDIELKGETKDFTAGGSGSTSFKCFGLMAENVDVDISGAGDAEVYASVKLNVDVSGAAGVKYKGNASVSQKVTGAGSVKKVE